MRGGVLLINLPSELIVLKLIRVSIAASAVSD